MKDLALSALCSFLALPALAGSYGIRSSGGARGALAVPSTAAPLTGAPGEGALGLDASSLGGALDVAPQAPAVEPTAAALSLETPVQVAAPMDAASTAEALAKPDKIPAQPKRASQAADRRPDAASDDETGASMAAPALAVRSLASNPQVQALSRGRGEAADAQAADLLYDGSARPRGDAPAPAWTETSAPRRSGLEPARAGRAADVRTAAPPRALAAAGGGLLAAGGLLAFIPTAWLYAGFLGVAAVAVLILAIVAARSPSSPRTGAANARADAPPAPETGIRAGLPPGAAEPSTDITAAGAKPPAGPEASEDSEAGLKDFEARLRSIRRFDGIVWPILGVVGGAGWLAVLALRRQLGFGADVEFRMLLGMGLFAPLALILALAGLGNLINRAALAFERRRDD